MSFFHAIRALGLLAFATVLQAQDSSFPAEMGEPNDGMMKQKPLTQDLGGGRYRIGSILLDKKRKTLTLQGEMLPTEVNKAIEFLATMKKGFKSYESVMTLDANAFEFNLACILIGLDGAKTAPRFHFDPNPLEGDPVSISISWQQDEQRKTIDVIELLRVDGKRIKAPSRWNYTGSKFEPSGAYLAQMDGVLIGIIHDPASIIDHNTGLGLGNWGAITVDPDIAPAAGTRVTLTLKNLE
jgi:hypothetical protein